MRTSKKTPKIPKPITAASLERAALDYLQRYGGPSGALRKVLWRKVARVAPHHPVDREQVTRWMDELLLRLQRVGVLDDEAWATSRARTLLARGVAPALIRQRLRAKGVASEAIDAALFSLVDDNERNPRLLAAIAYARRRRFGPWRPSHKRAERRDKDLAAMRRAGFPYRLAVQVVDAEDVEALEEIE